MALTSMHRVLFRTGLLVECVKKKSASTVPSLKRKKKTGEEANKKGEIDMCYNCGCGMPNNDMGNPANITTKTFEEAAKAMKQSAEDAKKNARQLLDKVINTQQQSNDKNWKP